MATGTYSGAWLRGAYVDPIQAVLHTADPAHTVPGQVPDQPVVTSAPQLTETAPLGEYPGSEWIVSTPGLVLDTTPATHTQGAPGGIHATRLDQQTASTVAHDVDLGGTAKANFYPLPLQFADEVYTTTRVEGLDTTSLPDIALRRGLNGDPANNPDGFRRGFDFSSWVYRKFAVPPAGDRMHDMHVLTPNTVTEIPPQAPTGSPYLSPYGSQARAMTRTWSLPSVRREPPPIDQWSQTDGQSTLYAPTMLDDWVVS
jgi:hypothetical protein